MRELAEAVQPFSSGGAYITQMGVEAEEGAERIKAARGTRGPASTAGLGASLRGNLVITMGLVSL